MYGRYGIDSLSKFILAAYIAVALTNLILSFFDFWTTGRFVFYAAELALIALFFFRAFSKNIYKRSAENRKYCELKTKFKAFTNMQKCKWRDRKTHVYKKCPNCKAALRLPRKKGKHTVCCPKCKKDFEVNI